ncbi:hypothetical protein Psal006b_00092 [Piscirickettsia salmonis]|uniref:Uncharacterized protein n=1 Tax=Piscirickettsia salmonis TaxID=1238 RepID=A0AAC8ZQ13_PISSA|nr:hypothetical protein [Piscirickettsia salmonis]ALB24255.1 hypothetical protein KU39_3082 [Piscirickettsia salmonis]QGN97152.1 hypothetical protein Psal006b_00092 [Piscirickettsia salmonis]QGO00748.1 hypothetical protein Psal008_00095 [Piscirickettsia salmonis]QGO11473.1 hypothetical protein Psal010b_00092 [Piscirickettsia salmonis]QGO18495.1 hypothetical protein Psal013_00094 [Piscirickettsia salmonis]
MHYVINKLKSQIEKQKATLLDDEGSRPPSSEVQHYSILSRHQIL